MESPIEIIREKTKRVKAYKNPIMLKKNDITLERDSIQENIYYISFTYTSLYNFNLHIFFNSTENFNQLNENIKNNNTTYNYKPSVPLQAQTVVIKNVPAAINEKFLDKNAKIDLNEFINEKLSDKSYHDMIIECVVLKNEKVECALSTYCKIIKTQDNRVKVKVETQKLNINGNWFETRDVYGLEESNSNSNECEVCYTNKKNTIFLSCMHSYACNDCSVSVMSNGNKCPLCRQRIKGLLLIEEKKESCKEKDGQN